MNSTANYNLPYQGIKEKQSLESLLLILLGNLLLSCTPFVKGSAV